MRALWTLSLRARLMIIGLTGVGLALLVGGLAFYGALTFAVNRALDNGAQASADEVAAMVDQDRLPSPVPVSGAQVIQVVDAQQRVLGGSATADRLTPLLRPAELGQALAGEPVLVPGARIGIFGPLRVRAVTAGPASAPVSVIVAVPYGDVLAARAALRTGLLLTFPVLLGALAAIAWRVIGRTLRPVEALRAGAEQISRGRREAAVGERLPVPQAADEIQALAVTLNEMLDRLGEARARQRTFIADAAHELRSPLASVRAQLEVAERLGEGGDLARDLLVDVNRLTRLVEDLLLLARADADARPPARPTVVPVNAVLVDLAAAYGDARVPVSVAGADATSALVEVDVEEFRRALDNLVANGVRHARSAVVLGVARERAESGSPRAWGCWSRSATTGRASPPRIGSACSSGSPGSTTPGHATREAPASAWRSPANCSAGPAARSPWRRVWMVTV